jgi:tetratricopeptide (TPR) repeat protein
VPEIDPKGARPGALVTLFVGGLSLAMLAMLGWMWQSGALSPDRAVAVTIIRQNPAHAAIAAILDSARKYMTEGEWSKAEAILREASGQYPDEQEIYIALGETLVAVRKFDLAYEEYEKALAVGPRDGKVEFAAGLVANSAGRADRAIEHFFAAQVWEPANATYAMNLGLVQRKTGDIEGAKANLLRSANLDPDNAFAWGVLADIALGENNVGISLTHIAKARVLQPDSKDWRLIEARALKRRGDPERALMVLTPMEVSQRREPAVVRLMAECYGMLGRHAQAATVLADASLADGSNAELAYEAALAFERLGDKAKALEFGERAKILGSEPAARLVARLSQ